MGKVSRNRKGLKPETVVTLWNDLKTKLTVKELCNVLELPQVHILSLVTTNGRSKRGYRRSKGYLS